MGDMKDKFKGFMKKVTPSSSSGKFQGQGRVLGSSSGSTNPNLNRPSSASQFVNPNRNFNSPSANSKPTSDPLINRPNSVDSQKGLISNTNAISNPNSDPNSNQSQPSKDGFDPFGSLITTGKRNKNGYSLDSVFECPVCNSGFTSEEEVSLHIESCIAHSSSNDGGSGSRSGDADGVGLDLGSVEKGSGSVGNEAESTNKLEACVGVYLSGNPGEGSIDVVLRLLRNIVKEPENGKFRRIRMGNPKIREAVGEVTGGIELLEVVGFELKEEEAEMWAVMDTPSEERISMMRDLVQLLEQAKGGGISSASLVKMDEKVETETKVKESEPKIIDRQIKVFFSVSESVAARIVLPDSFYNLTIDEVRREAEMRRKKLAESQLLIPKSYKEKQAQAARRRYNRSIIRVQFPDGVVLQGVFSPKEPTTALYEFVSSSLKQQGLEFELVHPLPVKRRVIPCFPAAGQRASTLEEEDLVPSALIKFKPFETDSMVFTGLTNELLEISEPLGSSTF